MSQPKTRGLLSLLEDRERLFDLNEVNLALKAAVFKTLYETGKMLSVERIDEICEEVCNTLKTKG